MEFSIAFLKNSEQFIFKTFNSENKNNSKILSFDDLKFEKVDGLIFNQDLKNEDFETIIESELKFYPIRSNTDLSIDASQFESLSFDQAKPLFDKIRENWILQNNLNLIEEIFKTQKHLLNLIPNDRASFFEELWFILKANLGAQNIKLYYNDLIKAKNENEKNKLVKVKIIGSRFPEPTSIDEADEIVLKNYEKDFGQIFDVTDYNKEKGQLVICATIKKSPVLIMANVFQFTRIQKAILTSLFEGLNQ